MKAIKIERPSVSNASYILSKEQLKSLMEEVYEMFTEDEFGEMVTITLIEIDEKVFEELDEFQGW